MMKYVCKNMILLVVFISAIMLFSACKDDKPITTLDLVNTSISTTPEFKYATLLPAIADVFSKESEIVVSDEDGGSSYIFHITNATYAEYEKYIQACTDKGFSYIPQPQYNTKDAHSAYTEDGKYTITVYYIDDADDGRNIQVICKVPNKNPLESK